MLLAEPRGFCAGVEMAIKALTWMVGAFEPPVYCYHEIVHNAATSPSSSQPAWSLSTRSMTFRRGAPIMLSAHGSSPEVTAAQSEAAAVMVDAVCPLVTKVHHEVKRRADEGYAVICVGHRGRRGGGHDDGAQCGGVH